MAYYMTEEQVRRSRIAWNLEQIERIDPEKADWCKAEANRLYNQFVNNDWTDEDGKIIPLDSWLDTITETTRIELETWQARRRAYLDEE